jgi:predicted Zn-dependent protease
MKTGLSRAIELSVQAVEAWVELGNQIEAAKELEKIPQEFRFEPEVLKVEYAIHATKQDWDAAAEVADAVSELDPDNSWGVRHHAIALAKQQLLSEAWDILFPELDRFKEWQICYDLARYAVRLGKLTEGFTLLAEAIQLNGARDLKRRALDDPDFEPLWVNLGSAKPGT